MWRQIRNNPRAAVLAVLAHIVFIAILVLSFTFSRDETGGVKRPEPEVIKARAVDEKQIDAQMKRLRDAKTRKQQKIKEQADRKKQARLREQARLAEKKAQKKRKQEAIRKQKEVAEKKRQAQLKIEQQRQKRLAEEKKRRQTEQKRIKEEERKRQKELARQEAEMKQKLAADRRRTAAQQQANQREISKYLGLIKNAVTQHWTLPSQEVKGLRCKVKVRIIPNGEVIDVQIIKSSGNLAFDRSVETAVYRAAPLPVPSIDSGLFDKFREVKFLFKPRDISSRTDSVN
ncbi:MAG TPA: cell envelope integrity protein TolA [Gammaproteobacteria bacterium]|nr:cell envelope integrity protein TolA [Gammaproteobacteria bacterium]